MNLLATLLLSAGIWCFGISSAWALELVMFETKSCQWCAEWHRVIGPIYPKSAEGKRALLRRIDLHDARPSDLAAIKPVVYTPTFVLVEEGVEMGRIEGYPGEEFFWGLLAQQLAKIPKQSTN